MYVCGITPYEAAHLGHAFTYHVFDVIARRLRSTGVHVQHVRNITDVDDDILRVARKRHMDFRALGDKEVQLFNADMADIDLMPVDDAPRATQHVPEMVSWIERLQQREFAYEQEGWVYFDVARFAEYGALAHLDRTQMLELSRERGGDPDDPRKRGPLDFVLWQRSRDDEPHWPSPWGEGRPGWHIECSVLSTGALGAPIDIHGGGEDLIFPHHESEIAQAVAAGVSPYVRHWVHVAMVEHQGEKMSKSLGNLIFVRDLINRIGGPAVRLLLASHHYRQSWPYEENEVRAAEQRYSAYASAMRDGTLAAAEAAQYEQDFFARIDDNLDTPAALRVLDDAATAAVRSPNAAGAQPAGPALTRMLHAVGAHPASVAV